jgi:hypothetical protein
MSTKEGKISVKENALRVGK